MKLYVASSWRNPFQLSVVASLRTAGHEVYDFRNPCPGDTGFAWSDIEPDWLKWDAARFRTALDHSIAKKGFAKDWNAMQWADAGVMVLPTGRSAHLEAGYFVGAGKLLFILLLGTNEPELMYKMADGICLTVDELIMTIARHQFKPSSPAERLPQVLP